MIYKESENNKIRFKIEPPLAHVNDAINAVIAGVRVAVFFQSRPNNIEKIVIHAGHAVLYGLKDLPPEAAAQQCTSRSSRTATAARARGYRASSGITLVAAAF